MPDSDEPEDMPAENALPSAEQFPVLSAVPLRLSVGALLAETRAAAGRDLADVSRETRIPLRHLMAIEADDHHSLPALPYALGFVKSYARSLGLSAEAVAAQFRGETSIMPHVPTAFEMQPMAEARLPSRQVAWGSAAALVLLVGALGLYGAGVFDPAPQSPKPEQVAEQLAATAAPTDPADVDPAAADPVAATPDAAGTVPGVADTMAVTAAGPAGPGGAAAPPSAPTSAPVSGAIPSTGMVVLVAQEDVWVKIYDRATGRRAFMGVLAAGQRYAVPADGPPLTLRAGRAGVVQVQVAGVVLPSLGGPVSTIDGVVLTAPALAARFAPALPEQPVVQQGASRPGAQIQPRNRAGSPSGD